MKYSIAAQYLLNLFFVFFLLDQATAAIPKPKPLEEALMLPLDSRVAEIQKSGAEGEKELIQMAFDKSEKLSNRWRAVTALGRIYPKSARPHLEKALKSEEWFMRNAVLVVLPYNDKKWATEWARVMMHDQALVVRTAAVRVLRQLNAKETEPLLWEKLYSSENYRGRQSLWIRRHILEALAQFAGEKDTAKFIGVLSDRDESLHPLAMRTLQRLTKKNFNDSQEWVSWWRNGKKV